MGALGKLGALEQTPSLVVTKSRVFFIKLQFLKHLDDKHKLFEESFYVIRFFDKTWWKDVTSSKT